MCSCSCSCTNFELPWSFFHSILSLSRLHILNGRMRISCCIMVINFDKSSFIVVPIYTCTHPREKRFHENFHDMHSIQNRSRVNQTAFMLINQRQKRKKNIQNKYVLYKYTSRYSTIYSKYALKTFANILRETGAPSTAVLKYFQNIKALCMLFCLSLVGTQWVKSAHFII